MHVITAFASRPVRSSVLTLCYLSLLMGLDASVQGVSAQQQEEDRVVARVNDFPIYQSCVYQKIESLPLGEQIDVREQLARFVESVIQEEVFFQSELQGGFRNDPKLRDQVKAMVTEYLVKHHVMARIQVTDKDIAAFYRANTRAIRGEHVRVRQIVRQQRTACESLKKRITSESSFIELARQVSLDAATAEAGGDLGTFMYHPNLSATAQSWFDMQKDEMRIFESAQGCHLVLLVDKVSPPLPPLENVRERIRTYLTRNQEVRLLRELIAARSKGMHIRRYPLPK